MNINKFIYTLLLLTNCILLSSNEVNEQRKKCDIWHHYLQDSVLLEYPMFYSKKISIIPEQPTFKGDTLGRRIPLSQGK